MRRQLIRRRDIPVTLPIFVPLQSQPQPQPEETKMPEDRSNEARWSVIIGGGHACRPQIDDEGHIVQQLRTCVNPIVVYNQIKDIQLNAIWAILDHPEVKEAADHYRDVLAKYLSKLGISYGLQKGTISEEQFKEYSALKALWED